MSPLGAGIDVVGCAAASNRGVSPCQASGPVRNRQPARLTARAGCQPQPLLLVRVLDLALGGLFERHRQVVLRARLDERGQELVESAFAELVVVVVDLPGALRGHDDEGVARVHVVEQFVDAGMDHGLEMLPAARGAACRVAQEAVQAQARAAAISRLTIVSNSSMARSSRSLTIV